MNLVSQLLPASHVLLDVALRDKQALFEQVGALFEQYHQLSRKVVVDSLVSREKMGSTGLGHAIAIPHGRVKGLKQTLCAFVRSAQPIEWESYDGLPVRLIFIVLVPQHANEQHLQILGQLAQLFSDAALREQLQTCSAAEAAHKLLTQWSPYAPSKRSAAL